MTGCLLDFAYFVKKYRLTAADLSKQKVLGADSRTIQQIIFEKQQQSQEFLTFSKSQKKPFYSFQKE